MARYLVESGAPICGQLCNKAAVRGYTALHLASYRPAFHAVLQLLLPRDLNAGSPSFRMGVNPIHIATACNNLTGLKTLLQHIKEHAKILKTIHQNDHLGSSTFKLPLDSWKASLPICDIQINSFKLKWVWPLELADPTIQPSGFNITTNTLPNPGAIHIATLRGSFEAVKLLLEMGASVDLKTSKGQTPLHIAANNGHLDVAKLLLENGANLNAIATNGMTPLMYAARFNHVQLFTYLVDMGASIYERDPYGGTVLYHAGCSSPRIFAFLLSHGCDAFVEDYEGKSPLKRALEISSTCPAMGTLVVNWGLDFDHIAEYRPIAYPLMKRLLKRLPKNLVSHQLKTRYFQETLLVEASIVGDYALVEFLLNLGADMEFEGSPDGTALLAACKRGRFSSVAYLIRAGAQIFGQKDGAIVTAIEAARDHPEIVHWLLVDRYIEQPKLCWTDHEDHNREVTGWAGPIILEIPTAGLYSPQHGISMIEKAKELSQLRYDLLGNIVHGTMLTAEEVN